jgi:hypothetical protein
MDCIVNGPGESKHADIGISLPGTGEQPTAPVFIDGKKAATLRGPTLAADFQAMVVDYIERATAPPNERRRNNHPTSALAAMLTVSAISAALNRNDTTPCAATVRRMVRPVTATSETCDVIPITSEK